MIKYNCKKQKSIFFYILCNSKVVSMIRIKLSELLGKHKMNQKTLSRLTNIRPATISKMYYEETKRIDINQLDSLCRVFDCEISELLEYVPNKKDSK